MRDTPEYTTLRLEQMEAEDRAFRSLTPWEYSNWSACGSSHRFQAYRGKVLLLIEISADEKPTIVEEIQCVDFSLHMIFGLRSVWFSARNEYTVSDVPVQIEDGCFLHGLTRSSVENTLYRGERTVKFPLVYRNKIDPRLAIKTRSRGLFLIERGVYRNV